LAKDLDDLKKEGYMKKVCFFLVFFIVSFLNALTVKAASDEIIQLRLSSWWPKAHIMSNAMEAWIKDIETETEGKVRVTYFPAGQLANDKDAFEKVGKGITDMAPIICELYPAELPLSQVNSMPFLFKSSVHGGKVINITKDYFKPEFENNKLKIMWGFVPPPYPPLMSKKPILKMADWKGVRVKTSGINQADTIKLLGGTPVVIIAGEMYTSLQRGTVDGIIIPMSAATSFKMDEVIKHVTEIGMNSMSTYLSMYIDKWNSLPKEIQEKIMLTNKIAAERTGNLYDEAEKKAIEEWKIKGISFHSLTIEEQNQWIKKTSPVWDAWMEKCKEKGLNAAEVAHVTRKLASEN